MSGSICLNGQAIACFLDGPNLTIVYDNLNVKRPEVIQLQHRQIHLNPKNLFCGTEKITKTTVAEAVTDVVSKSDELSSRSTVSNSLTCVTFSNDARFLAVADSEKTIFILTTSTSNEWRPLNSFQIEKRKIVALKFTEDNEFIVMVDKAGEVFSADLKKIDCEIIYPDNPKKILGHCSYITDMILLDQGRQILTCDRDAKIRVSLFPEGFVTERYFLGHTKSIVGIAPVCFEKFLLSVAVDGECILWSLDESYDEMVLKENVFDNILELDGKVSVVESMKVTTFRGKTVFGVKVSSETSKLLFLFELVFRPSKKFNIRLIPRCQNENESDSKLLDFVLTGDLILEYFSSKKVQSTQIKLAEVESD